MFVTGAVLVWIQILQRDQPVRPTASSTPDDSRKHMVSPTTNPNLPTGVGRRLYESECSSCHGDYGTGSPEKEHQVPPLPSDLTVNRYKYGTADSQVFAVIKNGVPYTGMTPFDKRLTDDEISQIVNYLRFLRRQ